MLTHVNPKLPMRNKAATKDFYLNQLGFQELGSVDYDEYLMVTKDDIEIHFFEFKALDPKENYGQVYIRTNDIDTLYQEMLDKKLSIHPAGPLQVKPWGQKEFSMLDPDNNLLTFGQGV
jgi:catechol 2,3-dioxygenase-like lactoylglutathione lyase family enzyme